MPRGLTIYVYKSQWSHINRINYENIGLRREGDILNRSQTDQVAHHGTATRSTRVSTRCCGWRSPSLECSILEDNLRFQIDLLKLRFVSSIVCTSPVLQGGSSKNRRTSPIALTMVRVSSRGQEASSYKSTRLQPQDMFSNRFLTQQCRSIPDPDMR